MCPCCAIFYSGFLASSVRSTWRDFVSSRGAGPPHINTEPFQLSRESPDDRTPPPPLPKPSCTRHGRNKS